MKSILIAGLFMIVAGCAVDAPKAPITAERLSNDVAAGGKLFTQHCASCHGAGAQGTTRAPSLHSASVQMMSDDALVQFLTDGDLRRGMPSWSRLPEERRWQLTRYVKSLSGPAGR
ncbi:MAG TPA: c-type cytochrome [Thermoanaerobaculia bacterium]|jgi:mono/diheme cytochrome c family protein|nr:c-type cytochrome [Thermoanaerobaculia bacterium]